MRSMKNSETKPWKLYWPFILTLILCSSLGWVLGAVWGSGYFDPCNVIPSIDISSKREKTVYSVQAIEQPESPKPCPLISELDKTLELLEEDNMAQKIMVRYLKNQLKDAQKSMESFDSIQDLTWKLITTSGLSDDALILVLKNFANIDVADIPQNVTVTDFVARFAEIAAKDLLLSSQCGFAFTEPSDFPNKPVLFDTTTGRKGVPLNPRTVFSQNEGSIYAIFDTTDYPYHQVLAKWIDVESSRVYLMDKIKVKPMTAYNHIAFDLSSPWPQGQYIVEIYSLDNNLSLMASGQYEVW